VLGVLVFCTLGGDKMILDNPIPMDRMYTDDGHLVHCRIASIVGWNMDFSASKLIVNPIGAYWQHILGIQAWIRNDANDLWTPLERFGDAADPSLKAGGVSYLNGANIALIRRAGGFYDSADYDEGGGFERGNIYIWYYE